MLRALNHNILRLSRSRTAFAGATMGTGTGSTPSASTVRGVSSTSGAYGLPPGGEMTSLDRLMRAKPQLKDKRFKTWYGDASQDDSAGLEEDADYEEDYSEYGEGEEPDQYDPLVKVGRQLLRLGKVTYKHVEPLPPWLRHRKDQVTSHRTSHQLRKALKDWMIKPDRDVYTKYRTKRLFWREFDKPNSDGSMPSSASGQMHVYGPSEAVAYTHYFFPGKFTITRRIFREVQSLLPDYQPRKMLDFGCGPGTGGAAALDVWGEIPPPTEEEEQEQERSASRYKHKYHKSHKDEFEEQSVQAPPLSAMQYTGVDPSQSMLDAAAILMSDSSNGRIPTLWDRVGDVVKRCHKTGERFDLINASFVLSELAGDPMRRAAVLLLYELLAPGGCLVIAEGGSPVGSHTVRTARQLLLDKFGKVTQQEQREQEEQPQSGRKTKQQLSRTQALLEAPNGLKHSDLWATVLAPCTHDKVCPLRPGAWCSFSQRVHSPLVRSDNAEKYSYVVMQRAAKDPRNSIMDWAEDSGDADVESRMSKDPTPLQVLRDAALTPKGKEPAVLEEVDWEEYQPSLRRQEWSRILRSPLKRNGHIVMDLCGPDGDLQRATVTRGTLPKIPALYAALRKTSWGGLHPALQNGEGLSTRSSTFALSAAEKLVVANKKAAATAAAATSLKQPKWQKQQQDKDYQEHSPQEEVEQESLAPRAGAGAGADESESATLRQMWESIPDTPLIDPTQKIGRRALRARRGAALSATRRRRRRSDAEENNAGE